MAETLTEQTERETKLKNTQTISFQFANLQSKKSSYFVVAGEWLK